MGIYIKVLILLQYITTKLNNTQLNNIKYLKSINCKIKLIDCYLKMV